MPRPTEATISNPRHARQAIVTRYRGPTNYRGARIIVRTEGGIRRTIPWDDALGVYANHANAALHLARDMEWHGRWVGGSTPDGYAFNLDTGE